MSRHAGQSHRFCRRAPRIDIARLLDEEPDAEFVERMVALYREHFDGQPTNG